MSWSLPRSNVVVPWASSSACGEALAAALTMVERADQVTVLHVVEPIGAIATFADERNREAQEHLQDTLDELRTELAGHPSGDAIGAVVRYGPVAETVADYVTERNCDLVVMPSSRRSGVKRLLLGSVTEKVLRRVDAAVLVITATHPPS